MIHVGGIFQSIVPEDWEDWARLGRLGDGLSWISNDGQLKFCFSRPIDGGAAE